MIIIWFASCDTILYKQIQRIDIQRDTTIILAKKPGQEHIWKLRINIEANLTDSINLTISEGGNVNYDYRIIEPKTELYNSDWYNNTCFVSFSDLDKTIQNLKIEYIFYD